jgi:hypothetical protein
VRDGAPGPSEKGDFKVVFGGNCLI